MAKSKIQAGDELPTSSPMDKPSESPVSLDLRVALTPIGELTELNELRRRTKQAAHDAEWHRINSEYKPAIAPTIHALRETLAGLKACDPDGGILAACERALQTYPANDLDPKPVREAVRGLRGYAGGVKHTLTVRPVEIERLLVRFENPDPAKTLESMTVATRLDIDRRDAAPYIGIDKGLAGFFEILIERESDVKMQVAEALRGQIKARPVMTHPPARGDDDVRTLMTAPAPLRVSLGDLESGEN